ncbi:MAG TPA: PAS domain S-box protein [Candidatus Limnocylindrales bacterium]|nr:PAS domain S-box protein [Candidatus Limnocylindrales bacterium]
MLNQGLQGIAFFEATVCLTLLVLFVHLRRDNAAPFYRLWLFGWVGLTLSSFSELAMFYTQRPSLHVVVSGAGVAALALFLASILQFTAGQNRLYWPMLWLTALLALTSSYYESRSPSWAETRWETAILESTICLTAGWFLWRASKYRPGHGAKLLAGALTLLGLNNIDRRHWTHEEISLLRFAFDHFLNASLGIGMIVLLLESARTRSEEISEKMQQFTMLTASSSQSVGLKELLRKVLKQIVSSVNASHGIIRLLEGKGDTAEFVVCASVGFPENYLKQNQRMSFNGVWVQEVLKEEYRVSRFEEEKDVKIRRSMVESGISQLVTVPLCGKEGPVGLLNIGTPPGKRFQEDELTYLVNVGNFLGTTIENVNLFEQIKSVQQQWVYTFDSIGDPILVHDQEGRVLRTNTRLADLLGRKSVALVGRVVSDLLNPREAYFTLCPYCEGVSGEGDFPDPWLAGYFLASNSQFTDPAGRELGTIHVLKDITERKKAEEKYRTLVASVQEGVFIATSQGRFLDFNDALMRITGYENRDELMSVDIRQTLYVSSTDRDRLLKILNEHGAVNDFEFEIRRKDGEIRTVSESSTAVRDSAGNVTAYQGFLLDVSERRRAEKQIRRRNRELVVLNSIAETLSYTLDLNDSVHRTLRQILELFELDVASLHLLDRDGTTLRRVAAVGLRSEYAKGLPPMSVSSELIHQLHSAHATFLSVQGMPLPPIVREVQKKENLASAYVVTLWSKEQIIGGLVVGTRTFREFSAADISLLIAVGSQVAGAVDRSRLYEETRQAYENLRRTQEQLVHSEKLAAVGQLISGVAHELNNPLTAILGYSQLLSSNGQAGTQALSYSEKLYKQAQRAHRIVQNLLSFGRQHKPERIPVQLNAILEDTMALRDYDLRMSHIGIHLDLAAGLPEALADPHQLQQVFLNLINNAVDAILEKSAEGDLWVRTGIEADQIFIEFTDSGPGVQDPTRVFDPFYTTKPVGKGTGLGLSICYGIVTEHGGRILVQNEPGRGAKFRIELPLQSRPEQTVAPQAVSSQPVRSGRILVLEGNESVRENLARALSENEHSVTVSKTVAEARQLLASQEFDLVLANWQMVFQGDNGSTEPCQRHDGHGLGSRVLWMSSASADGSGVARILPPDAVVLHHPIRIEDLRTAVEAKLLGAVAPLVQE